jgi:hypothetical protein
LIASWGRQSFIWCNQATKLASIRILGVFESHGYFLALSFLAQIAQKEPNIWAILELFATNSL